MFFFCYGVVGELEFVDVYYLVMNVIGILKPWLRMHALSRFRAPCSFRYFLFLEGGRKAWRLKPNSRHSRVMFVVLCRDSKAEGKDKGELL